MGYFYYENKKYNIFSSWHSFSRNIIMDSCSVSNSFYDANLRSCLFKCIFRCKRRNYGNSFIYIIRNNRASCFFRISVGCGGYFWCSRRIYPRFCTIFADHRDFMQKARQKLLFYNTFNAVRAYFLLYIRHIVVFIYLPEICTQSADNSVCLRPAFYYSRFNQIMPCCPFCKKIKSPD